MTNNDTSYFSFCLVDLSAAGAFPQANINITKETHLVFSFHFAFIVGASGVVLGEHYAKK